MAPEHGLEPDADLVDRRTGGALEASGRPRAWAEGIIPPRHGLKILDHESLPRLLKLRRHVSASLGHPPPTSSWPDTLHMPRTGRYQTYAVRPARQDARGGIGCTQAPRTREGFTGPSVALVDVARQQSWHESAHTIETMKAPDPLVIAWHGRRLRVRHDDPRLGPYTHAGGVIRAAVELASDVDGLRLVLGSAVGDRYRVMVSDDGELVGLWRRS